MAPDETAILLHPALPLVGVSIAMARESVSKNDSLVNGYTQDPAHPRVYPAGTAHLPAHLSLHDGVERWISRGVLRERTRQAGTAARSRSARSRSSSAASPGSPLASSRRARTRSQSSTRRPAGSSGGRASTLPPRRAATSTGTPGPHWPRRSLWPRGARISSRVRRAGPM